MFVLCRVDRAWCSLATPSLNSMEGWPRAEFMFKTVHAVSVVDLVVADWTRAMRKERVCIYNVKSVSCQWRQVLKALTVANN